MDGLERPDTILQPYLAARERLVWTGRPARGIRLSAADAYLIPFSLLWAGFMVFWNFGVWTAAQGEAPWFFKLWGLPFLIAGLYFVAGRFVVDAWVRSRTVYGLTGQRAIIVRRVWGEQLLAPPLDHSIQLKRQGQVGDIEFGYRAAVPIGRGRGGATLTPALSNQVTFIGIPDALEVYRKAQALVEKSDPI